MRAYTERVLKLNKAAFQRTLGVKPEVYMQMRNVLEQREEKKKKSGRPPKLSLDDQLVLTLSWWREYRTHHHLSLDWGVDESTIRRTIERVENALIHSGHFRLPGRKALKEASVLGVEAVGVDLTESPVERPKKSSAGITAGRKSAIPTKAR